MSESRERKELGQISVYLAKQNNFERVIDWESGIRKKPKYRDHSFVVDEVSCQFLYFESFTDKTNPPWLDFANEQLPSDRQIAFSSDSRSPNGVLGLQVEGRLFIAAFGRSASATLIRKELEPDFGIKTAMNLCGNEEIRQTRTQSNSITPTHIDRQVGRPSDTFVFGLNEAEDLKSISAHMKGDPKVTLQGRDHLTVKILGDEKLSWHSLIKRCATFLAAYDRKDYVDLFPNYRNFKPASDDDNAALDAYLIDTLQAGNLDQLQLWIPEFIPGDEYSFSYTDNDKRDNRIYSHLEASQLKDELNLSSITLKKIQAKRVFAYSHADDRVESSKRWSLYDCIIMEHKLGRNYFLLSDGVWKQVDNDFYQTVVDFVAHKVRQEPCESIYANISIADTKGMKNKEEIFNYEACRRRPESIHFDQAKLKIGSGRKDKEFCDILDLTDDGVMRIINCKPLKGTSAVTYLFAQTRFYCENFLKDQTFLEAIRGHIAASNSPTKHKYLAHVGSELRDVNGADYRICLWLLCDAREPLPTKTDLPLMAQYELKLMHDHLQQVCKFREIVIRFIPVRMVTFVKKVAPKKAA